MYKKHSLVGVGVWLPSKRSGYKKLKEKIFCQFTHYCILPLKPWTPESPPSARIGVPFLRSPFLPKGSFSSYILRFRGSRNLCFLGGASDKEPACQCRRPKRSWFNLWLGKIPWRRVRQPIPVFLPGESHGQRSLAGCSP